MQLTDWAELAVGESPPNTFDVEVQVLFSTGVWTDVFNAFYCQKAHHNRRRWRRPLTVEERLCRLEALVSQLVPPSPFTTPKPPKTEETPK